VCMCHNKVSIEWFKKLSSVVFSSSERNCQASLARAIFDKF
jgi:hypothetical protein